MVLKFPRFSPCEIGGRKAQKNLKHRLQGNSSIFILYLFYESDVDVLESISKRYSKVLNSVTSFIAMKYFLKVHFSHNL